MTTLRDVLGEMHTVGEVAAMFGVTTWAVRKWIRVGIRRRSDAQLVTLRAMRMPRGVRVTPAAIRAFVAALSDESECGDLSPHLSAHCSPHWSRGGRPRGAGRAAESPPRSARRVRRRLPGEAGALAVVDPSLDRV